MIAVRIENPRFPMGDVMVTELARSQLSQADIDAALKRHAQGDWGELEAEDCEVNELALIEGTRLLSAYRSQNGIRFWVLTEASRETTTVLLPSEY